MKRLVFLFPGQGSQAARMGKDFFDAFPVARMTFEEADEILKEKFSRVIFEGSSDVLRQTKNSQLAILIVSLAILRALRKEFPDLKPWGAAGLSLGEYSALCASGRIAFRDVLLLVRERALWMNKACEKFPGTAAAVLGLFPDEVETCVRKIPGLWIANDNYLGQMVIAGTLAGVAQGVQKLQEQGAQRVVPLEVSGAFHSPLMEMAQEALAPQIEAVALSESDVKFVMNATGGFVESIPEIRRYLTLQMTKTVRWRQGIAAFEAAHADLYLEVGFGKVLTGIHRKMEGVKPCLPLGNVKDLDSLSKHIDQEAMSCTS